LHAELVAVARQAEVVAGTVELSPALNFTRARGITRTALLRDGVAGRLEALVGRVLERA
jgi:hypothetical protein